MNKAFVKEDSVDLDAAPKADEMEAALEYELFGSTANGPKNYITPKGFERLQKDLQHLVQNERPALSEQVSGRNSLEEGSEAFQDIQNQLQTLDRQIRLLQRRIDLAEIIDPAQQCGDRVLFGATVTVLDETEALRKYRIVGVDEMDLKSGKISWVSPIGKALLQSQVGDVVLLKTPHGEEELEIQKIEFESFD